MKKMLLIVILILFIFSLTSISHAKKIGVYWISNYWYDQNISYIFSNPSTWAVIYAFPPYMRTAFNAAITTYYGYIPGTRISIRSLFLQYDQSAWFVYTLSNSFRSMGENVKQWQNSTAASRTSWASTYNNYNNNVNRYDAIFFAGLGTICGPFILPLSETPYAQLAYYKWGPAYQYPGLKWAFFEAGNVLRFPGYYFQCFSIDPVITYQHNYWGSYTREAYTKITYGYNTYQYRPLKATGLHGIYGFSSINKSLFLPDMPYLASYYVYVPGFSAQIWTGSTTWWDWRRGWVTENHYETVYFQPQRRLDFEWRIASMKNLGNTLVDYLYSNMSIPWAWSMAHYNLMNKYAGVWQMVSGFNPSLLSGEHVCSISAYGRDYRGYYYNHSGETFSHPQPNLTTIQGWWIDVYKWGTPTYLFYEPALI